ncbi:hypothetical protein [Bacillus sp. NPDC094106]|uniref:hypothetical protein n=1 Tax=Bacillus sp. NPDC094106 TaxID=3363949 RepID=UPI003803B9BC
MNNKKEKVIVYGVPVLLFLVLCLSILCVYRVTKNEIHVVQTNSTIRHELVSKELGISVDEFMLNQSSQQTGYLVKTKDNIYFADFKQEKLEDVPELIDIHPLTIREAKYLQAK